METNGEIKEKDVVERTWQTIIQNTVHIEGSGPEGQKLSDAVWQSWLDYERPKDEQKKELLNFFKSHGIVTLDDLKRIRKETRTWVKAFVSLSRGESYPFMKAYKLLMLYEQLLQCALKDKPDGDRT